MITFLSKFLISKDASAVKQREQYGMLCGCVGIALNLILFMIKLFAGIISQSISITADAINNLSDAGSSIVTLLGFKLAGRKADEDHPYGHGRIEYLAALFVSAVILAVGFNLLKDSIQKILHPQTLEASLLIIGILVIAIMIKCYMAYYNFRIGRKINSAALMVTGKDALSDCISTSAVLICTGLYYIKGINLDAYAGCIVSVFILYTGYNAIKEAVDPLLGKTPDPEFIARIKDIVMSFDERITGIHDLMVHDYGPGNLIISLHAEVPAHQDILAIHDVIDNLEKKLNQELQCMATIHMDPVDTSDPKVLSLKEQVKSLMKKIDDKIDIHDFRVVFGASHTNLIYDMVLPYTFRRTDEEVLKNAQELIQGELGQNYYSVIQIDKENYIHH